jgi:hypothetical protein
MRWSILFLLLVFVVGMAAFNSSKHNAYDDDVKEGFSNSDKPTVYTLGDSVLNNSGFVSEAESIPAILNKKGIITLAENGAHIKNVYSQFKAVAEPLDPKSLMMVLSVGGNNILKNDNIETMKVEYKALISRLKSRFPAAKIVVCDVYLPYDSTLRKYDAAITAWNAWLQTTYGNNKVNNVSILTISKLLGSAEDFTSEVEPSAVGGQIISDAIIKIKEDGGSQNPL